MVRWRADCNISRQAHLIACCLFLAALLLVVLLPPWSGSLAVLKLAMVVAIGSEWRRCLLKIRAQHGTLVWVRAQQWRWQGELWQWRPPAHCLPFATLLRLQSAQGTWHVFWLMRDAMPEGAWRALRYQLLSARESRSEAGP